MVSLHRGIDGRRHRGARLTKRVSNRVLGLVFAALLVCVAVSTLAATRIKGARETDGLASRAPSRKDVPSLSECPHCPGFHSCCRASALPSGKVQAVTAGIAPAHRTHGPCCWPLPGLLTIAGANPRPRHRSPGR